MKRLFILFLLVSTVSAADFNVTWTPVKEDIVNKEYLITVQNLKDEMRTVDVESFFEDTNFDTSQVHDVQLIECGSKKFESKVLKKNKLEKEVSHGKITFPSVKTLGKKNNKGTKTFILKFKTPPDGNYGKVGLKINGKKYHPYWNSTWSNRKKITLTGNTSGSQTDYQLLLNITYEAEMNSDFSDVRFCNDTDQLSAWLESKINESYALIWVKFPHTPTDGETEDYWMYYGNSGASAYWDGNATFEFFDDFEGSSLDTDKWDINIGSPNISGSVCTLSGEVEAIWSKNNFNPLNITMRTSVQVGETNKKHEFGLTDSTETADNGKIASSDSNVFGLQLYNNGYLYSDINDGVGTYTQTQEYTYNTDYHIYDLTLLSSSAKFYDNNIEKREYTNNIPTDVIPIWYNMRDSTGSLNIDWVFIRKYISSEPTYAFGDTEYYVDSIYFNSSNPYYNLIDHKGDIALNHTYSSSDDLEWTASALNNDTGLVITSMGSSEIDFITYEGILDWLQLVNLDNSKIYTLQNGSGDLEEHQASGNAVNFTIDLSPDDYEIEITAVPTPSPTVTPTGVQPANYSGAKLSDSTIKSFYYPFMYILLIIMLVGGLVHVFGN